MVILGRLQERESSVLCEESQCCLPLMSFLLQNELNTQRQNVPENNEQNHHVSGASSQAAAHSLAAVNIHSI